MQGRTQRKKKERQRKAARAALTVIMVAALCGALLLIAAEAWDLWQARTVKEDVQQLYRPRSSFGLFSLIGTACAEDADTEAGELPLPELQADFQQLYESNSDIVGWLTAGEDIDYPVVQRDNAYYLEHNYFGRKDANGTIFLNAHNVLFPRDDVLLIHGHSMRSGAMFGHLGRYRDEAYMRAHALIVFRTIYDPQDIYYIPVAGFDASMLPEDRAYFDVTPVLFDTEEEHQAYLDAVLARSLWASPADVTVEDPLMILITCSYQHDDGRFLLVCRQLREGETPEMFQEAP